MASQNPTDAEIIEAIEKSGYLFEQEIATLLETTGFHVETSWPFLDSDTGKSREIDIRAIKSFLQDEENHLQVLCELLIECKDSRSPFLFLERGKNAREQNPSEPREYVFPRKRYRRDIDGRRFQEVPAFKFLDFASHHYYFAAPNKATQFAKISRKGKDWVANHDGIYDSVFLPLAKALESRLAEIPRPNSNAEWKIVWLFFPIVVLRDQLFTLKGSEGQRDLVRRKRVTFVRHLDSEHLKGDYMMDFVTRQHLQKFVEEDVSSFVLAVVKVGTESPALLRGDDA